MSISYDYYKIFYYVAKYHSFNKAAAVLFNSQPNITRAVNNLEAELGCRLFSRSHTGVTLTEEGVSLFKYVEAAHRQLELGESMLNSRKALKHGNVTIGLSVGITENLLNKMILPPINDFDTSFPDIHLQIVNNSTPQLIADTAEGVINLAVITSFPAKNKKLTEVPLYSFRDIVIAGKKYASPGEQMNLRRLSEFPLISLWHETETYELYKTFYAKSGLEYAPSIETATTSQILSFASNGMGYGFISPESAKEALENGSVVEVRLSEPLPTRNIVLIHKDGLEGNIAASRLRNFIRDFASVKYAKEGCGTV